MERPGTLTRAESTHRATPTFQRPLSRPVSAAVLGGRVGGGGGAVRSKPIDYDYATGSTFSVKVNGKPVFMLGDFRKKVDASVKGTKFVSAFKQALDQQKKEKKQQDAIRNQYEKVLVPRFKTVEHTETGLTKTMLGLGDSGGPNQPPPKQGQIDYSRIDTIHPWENGANGGLEKYSPCVTSVFTPPMFQGLDHMEEQWQREPSSHLRLDFVYGYQGANCWDHKLFGPGPGQDNLFFVQKYDPRIGAMVYSKEVVYFAAATVVVFDLESNIQRFFHHTDDVTAMTLLRRVYQKPDASWGEMDRPIGAKAKLEWAKWECFSKGLYVPGPRAWDPESLLLPQTSEDFPQVLDGQPNDWRDWDLPNRCIVASGQAGRNPRVYVWKVASYSGETVMDRLVLATMLLGNQRLKVAALSFNSGGNLLLAMAADCDHTISIFNWRAQTKLVDGKGHGGPVDSVKFNPYSASAFASCGEKHLKFWEVGDAGATELESASGLFRDMAAPVRQNILTFTPRGNTLSGTQTGDVLVWSSGTVTGKIEAAHKAEVLGLLYVAEVGLFTCGRGGLLKMWDAKLKNTAEPLCVVNLRSFNTECLPEEDRLTSGRSMDWSTCPRLLEAFTDDATVDDAPARGVKGAPATHLSLRDLGATGVLLLGTTSNLVLLLGFRRVRPASGPASPDWASDGLGPDHRLGGKSGNSKEGPLAEQTWWETDSVDKHKGRGARPGHIPVAVFAYQNFDPAQPGYMAPGSTRCPWAWAVCGKKAVIRGHMSEAKTVAPLQSRRMFLSGGSDATVRVWDIGHQTLVESAYVHKPVRSAVWWSKRDPITGCNCKLEDGTMVFALGHEDGTATIWKTQSGDTSRDVHEKARDAFYREEDQFGKVELACILPLPRKPAPPEPGKKPSEQVFAVKYTPNGKYLGVARGDNCVDLYRHAMVRFEERPVQEEAHERARQKALGLTDEEIGLEHYFPYKRVGCCNDHSSAVLHLDFDAASRYMQSVSQSNEILYSYVPNGQQCTSVQEMGGRVWATQTCTLGWTVKSIWARGNRGNDINTLDRSNNKVPPWAPIHGGADPAPYPYPLGYIPTGSDRPVDPHPTKNPPGTGKDASAGHHVLAIGDDHSKVKLFRWPTFGFKQAFRSYWGHGSHIAQVRFTDDDDYLISAGGTDMSVFQWRHTIPNKVYVYNLPDKKDETGKYVVNDYEMRQLLSEHFTHLLKVDRAAAYVRHSRAARIESAARSGRPAKGAEALGGDEAVSQALAREQHVSEAELERLRLAILMQRMAVMPDGGPHLVDGGGVGGGDKGVLGEREVVSCAVLNEGSPVTGMCFPCPSTGAPMSDRWASVVLRSKEESDEVVSLYGAEHALNHPDLLRAGSFLRLHGLYHWDKDPGVQTMARFNEAVDAGDPDPAREWIKGGLNLGRPFNDDDYEGPSCNGRPHYLMVSEVDWGDSAEHIPAIATRALVLAKQRHLHRADGSLGGEDGDELTQGVRRAMALSQLESGVWAAIKLWKQSDKPYGVGHSQHGGGGGAGSQHGGVTSWRGTGEAAANRQLPNFFLWQRDNPSEVAAAAVHDKFFRPS